MIFVFVRCRESNETKFHISALHGCLVSVNSPDYNMQQLAMFESNILLSVSVPASLGQPEIASTSVTQNFIPAFYVHNVELLLTLASPQALLKVSSVGKSLSDITVS
jgi:hypothetical protein